MAEKNTLSILESIKQKMIKFDEKEPQKSAVFEGDEFEYVAPESNHLNEELEDSTSEEEKSDDITTTEKTPNKSAIDFIDDDLELEETPKTNENDDFLFENDDEHIEPRKPFLQHEEEMEPAESDDLNLDDLESKDEKENIETVKEDLDNLDLEEDLDDGLDFDEDDDNLENSDAMPESPVVDSETVVEDKIESNDSPDQNMDLDEKDDLDLDFEEDEKATDNLDLNDDDQETEIKNELDDLDLDEDDDMDFNEKLEVNTENQPATEDMLETENHQDAENSLDTDEEILSTEEETTSQQMPKQELDEDLEEEDNFGDINLDLDDDIDMEASPIKSEATSNQEKFKPMSGEDFLNSNINLGDEEETLEEKPQLTNNEEFTKLPNSSNTSKIPSLREFPDQSLLHNETLHDTSQSIRKLIDAKNIVRGIKNFSHDGGSFNELAVQLMEPKLEKWLNENLPNLVEQIVREEISKIVPKE